MATGLFLTQMLAPFWRDENNDEDDRFAVYKYFGSFSRSMLTMFEFMFANWPVASRVITETVDEWYVLFVLVYQIAIAFAVGRVLMGIFLQVTFHVANTDDTIMLTQK